MVQSKIVIALIGIIAVGECYAQDLRGVVDIHVHSDPDSVPRSIDAFDAARAAAARGVRSVVLKNHYEPTAGLAWLARKQVPGIEIFGGIALNLSVGGVNPAAVDRMTKVKGGLGRVVWMPTFDAENQVRFSKENRPYVSVSRNGALLPEVKTVLELIAKNNLVLATGHSTPAESLMMIREAKARGIKHIVVTHPAIEPVRMSVAQMKEAAAMGAYLEFVTNAVIGNSAIYKPAEYAAMIRAAGPQFVILSSDLGQAGNPLHCDGLEQMFALLRKNGFSVAEIERMAKTNPAKLLGLE